MPSTEKPEIPWDMPTDERELYNAISAKPPEERFVAENLFKRYADMCFALIQAADGLRVEVASLTTCLQQAKVAANCGGWPLYLKGEEIFCKGFGVNTPHKLFGAGMAFGDGTYMCEVCQLREAQLKLQQAEQRVAELTKPVTELRIQALRDAIAAQCRESCPGPDSDHGIGDFFSYCEAPALWQLLNAELARAAQLNKEGQDDSKESAK